MEREIAKLYTDFNGIAVVSSSEVPPSKLKCPFLNPVTRIKRDLITNEITDHRTRLTWGTQERAEDPSVNSSSVIASPAVKLFLNSVISDPNAGLSTIDLNYFYYQSKIPPDYCRLLVKYIPPASRKLLGIANLPDNATIYLRVTIAIPGRPDAGKIAQTALNKLLSSHGYLPAPRTVSLYTHVTNSIKLVSHSDDLLIKHDKRTKDIYHLSDSLKHQYQHKLTLEAKSYLGASIRLYRHPTDHSRDELGISMPLFVRAALTELNFTPTYKPASPMIYTPPTYTKADMNEVVDTSKPASIDQIRLLRKAVGKFRYYAPAVDILLIMPVSRLANQQSSTTLNTMDQLDRFLNFAYHHPSAELVYRPSNMIMWIHSDASHHGEPESKSRVAGYFCCGEPIFTGPEAPYNVNAAFDIISTKLNRVTGSTSESETGGMYVNATAACPHRTTLLELGHPQPATPIVYDNEVSGDFALGKAKQKKSKAFATRYYWLKDRLRIGDFRLVWKPGKHNLADYFTKAHPTHHVTSMRQVYIRDLPNSYPISNLSSRKPRASSST
jgi:hypothetical protein